MYWTANAIKTQKQITMVIRTPAIIDEIIIIIFRFLYSCILTLSGCNLVFFLTDRKLHKLIIKKVTAAIGITKNKIINKSPIG